MTEIWTQNLEIQDVESNMSDRNSKFIWSSWPISYFQSPQISGFIQINGVFCFLATLFNLPFLMKTFFARPSDEKCPQKALRSIIGTWSVIGPSRSVIGTRTVIESGPIVSRSVLGTRSVIGPFTLCNALILPVSNWYTVSNSYMACNWRRSNAHSILYTRAWSFKITSYVSYSSNHKPIVTCL